MQIIPNDINEILVSNFFDLLPYLIIYYKIRFFDYME
jgi:hypothetical protein